MDFENFKPPPKVDCLYRCEACGEEDWYAVRMPDGWKHESNRGMRRCGGLLLLIEERPGEATTETSEPGSTKP